MSRFYLPQIDGLRTLAFLSVFLHHLGPVSYPSIYNRFVASGWVGLDLFFVISGFLITSILVREKEQWGFVSIKKFMVRRILRIWPLFYTSIVFGFILFPLYGAFKIKIFSPQWTTMFQDYFLTFFLFIGNMSFAWKLTIISPVFSVLWSVCVEEQFYLVWGSVFSFMKGNLNKLLMGVWLFSILSRAFIYHFSETYHSYYYCTFSHLDPIVLGCLLGLNYESLKEISQKASSLILGLALAIYALLWISDPLELNSFSNMGVFIYSSLAMLLLFYSGITNRFLISILTWKPLTFFAKYTYGMYIFHNLGIIVSGKFTGDEFSLKRLFLAFGLTFGMGFISWHLIEKPFISLKKQNFSPVQTGSDS